MREGYGEGKVRGMKRRGEEVVVEEGEGNALEKEGEIKEGGGREV